VLQPFAFWSTKNPPPPPSAQQRTIIMTGSSISMELLTKQNAETSSAVIDLLASDGNFIQLSSYEGDLTVTRDKEDDEKLQVGIDYAKAKGVIDPDFVPEPYVQIDVLGKTPDQVADEILQSVESTKSSSSSSSSSGSVIVLVGLSGTGKGTTVTQLVQKLQATGSGVVTWSNGNIFRSVTLLAATWCEQNCANGAFDKEAALTKENLASFMGMLSFGKNPHNTDQYDTHIQGLGLDLWVSAVQNTDLKSPKVSKNIPTVAEVTQVRAYPPDARGFSCLVCWYKLRLVCFSRDSLLFAGRSHFVCSQGSGNHGSRRLGRALGRTRTNRQLRAHAPSFCLDTFGRNLDWQATGRATSHGRGGGRCQFDGN
jgi:hypothetical protein